MKLLPVNYLKRAISKILYAILFVVGFFIFSYPAAIAQSRFAAQSTEYVYISVCTAGGLKYQTPSRQIYHRVKDCSEAFIKSNLNSTYNAQTAVKVKVSSQAVLISASYSSFYFVKSIPQSGKSDPSDIVS